MKKLVNGKEVILTPAEEAEILAAEDNYKASRPERFKQYIDEDAGAFRAKLLSHGKFQELEYIRTENVARRWKAAGFPVPIPAIISHWAGLKGLTDQQACQAIIDASDNQDSKIDAIRMIRLAGHNAIDQLTINSTDAEFESVLTAVRTQLEGV